MDKTYHIEYIEGNWYTYINGCGMGTRHTTAAHAFEYVINNKTVNTNIFIDCNAEKQLLAELQRRLEYSNILMEHGLHPFQTENATDGVMSSILSDMEQRNARWEEAYDAVVENLIDGTDPLPKPCRNRKFDDPCPEHGNIRECVRAWSGAPESRDAQTYTDECNGYVLTSIQITLPSSLFYYSVPDDWDEKTFHEYIEESISLHLIDNFKFDTEGGPYGAERISIKFKDPHPGCEETIRVVVKAKELRPIKLIGKDAMDIFGINLELITEISNEYILLGLG